MVIGKVATGRYLKANKDNDVGLRSRFNIISLCAGTGAFDLGVRLAVPHARTVLYIEVEAYACAVLAARIKDRAMDSAPIWSDLTTFDGEPWRGAVDCIIAGLPCTPYSTAGKQRGDDDERAIWPAAIRIIEAVRPAMVFFENVPNFLRFFRPVGEELSRLGYEYQAGIFSAEECGAPQRRERLFILAYSPGRGNERSGEPVGLLRQPVSGSEPLAHSAEGVGNAGRERPGRQTRADARRRGARADVADTWRGSVERRRAAGNVARASRCAQGEEDQRQRCGDAACDCGDHLGNTRNRGCATWRAELARQQGQAASGITGDDLGVAQIERPQGERPGGQREPQAPHGTLLSGCAGTELAHPESSARHLHARSGGCDETASDASGLGIFPPGPADAERWAAIIAERPDLAPAIEREIRRVASGNPDWLGATRSDELRALGNLVVPITAALAFVTLAKRLGIEL